MDDVYAINVAKSNYHEGFNTADVDRVLSVFAPEFTDMSGSRPTHYRDDAATKLRRSLAELFAEYEAKLNVIILGISVFEKNAFDHGWHELTLTPRNGGEPAYRRTRYFELWSKQPNNDWRISKFMDNQDVSDIVDKVSRIAALTFFQLAIQLAINTFAQAGRNFKFSTVGNQSNHILRTIKDGGAVLTHSEVSFHAIT